WSKIEKRKGANDIKKGLLYSRTFRVRVLLCCFLVVDARTVAESVASRRGGGSTDPEQNNALAAVIKRAKSQGVPKENIENALKKISGENGKGDSHLVFEVMGPGSVGLIVECLSDNPNRTVKFLNTLLKDHGSRLADVKFLFKREGRVKIALSPEDDNAAREKLLDLAIDADAEDFEIEYSADETPTAMVFKCPHTSLHKLTTALTAPGVGRELLNSELVYAPTEPREDLDEQTAQELDELVEAIEDLDDTLRVWTTAESVVSFAENFVRYIRV
ncbi:YebC-like protein, partial [Trametes sanguinea]